MPSFPFYLLQIILTSSFLFGGGQIYIPILEELLVEQWELFSPQYYYSLVALALATPAAFATKIIAYSSYLAYGSLAFSVLSLLGFHAAGFVWALLGLYSVKRFQNSGRLSVLLETSKLMVSALMLKTLFVISSSQLLQAGSAKEAAEFIVLFLLSAWALHFRKLSPLKIILIVVCYGVISFFVS